MNLYQSKVICFAGVLVLSLAEAAQSASLLGKSIEIDGIFSASSYSGVTSNLDFGIFTRAYIGKGGRFLYSYDKQKGGKLIEIGKKISEKTKTYTITISKGTLLYRGKVRRTVFNYGFKLKFIPKGDTCTIRADIKYHDPDISYGFPNGYTCRIYNGNIFAN